MMKIFRHKRGKKGFTLIELMVSLVITSIIAITAFSILISASNTFRKEGDIADAMATKDMVMSYLKENLRKRESILLTDTNLSPVSIDGKEIEPGQVSGPKDGFIHDKKMATHHMMFSHNGRICTVQSTPECKYKVGADNYPLMRVPGEKYDYYASDLFDDNVYGKFNVQLEFRPLLDKNPLGKPEANGQILDKWHSLQVIIKVTDPAKNDVIVIQGSETFKMMNIVVKANEICYSEHTNADGSYSFCYFS